MSFNWKLNAVNICEKYTYKFCSYKKFANNCRVRLANCFVCFGFGLVKKLVQPSYRPIHVQSTPNCLPIERGKYCLKFWAYDLLSWAEELGQASFSCLCKTDHRTKENNWYYDRHCHGRLPEKEPQSFINKDSLLQHPKLTIGPNYSGRPCYIPWLHLSL